MAKAWIRGSTERWEAREGVTAGALSDTGARVAVSLLDMIAARIIGEQDTPQSGFVGWTDCYPVLYSGMQVNVTGGLGFYYDATRDPADYNVPMYRPVCVPDDVQVTLDAADPSNPRYDRISIKPLDVDGDPGDRRFRPADSPVVVQTVDQRTAYEYEIVVTKGTASGSPAVPALPSGSMPVAICYVAAGASAPTVYDARNLIGAAYGMEPIPPRPVGTGLGYARNVVSSGLQVIDDTGMTLDVTLGIADFRGKRAMAGGSVTLAASDPTDPRIDTVYVYSITDPSSGGVPTGIRLAVATGTPDPDPVRPTISAEHIPLSDVYVGAGATSIVSANITDRRPLAPYTDNLQSVVTVDPVVTIPAKITIGVRPFSIQSADADGNTLETQAVFYELLIVSNSVDGQPPLIATNYWDISTGTVVMGTDGSGGDLRLLVMPDSTGLIEGTLVQTTGAALNVVVRMTPVVAIDASVATAEKTGTNYPDRKYRAGAPVYVAIGFS